MPHPDSEISYLRTTKRKRAPKPTDKVQSVYDKYALPFFDGEHRSAWSVKPTGRYSDDCETGHAYGLQFLRTCDGTYGWAVILGQIVSDMIGVGPIERHPDGSASAGGLVIGFMTTISRALCSVDPAILTLVEDEQRRQTAWYREQMAKLRASTSGRRE